MYRPIHILISYLPIFVFAIMVMVTLQWMIRKDNDKRNLDRPKFKYFIIGLCSIGIMYILNVAFGINRYYLNTDIINTMLFWLYVLFFMFIIAESMKI